jgi:hypothetical protein
MRRRRAAATSDGQGRSRGERADVRGLILELVEGLTLAIARQIADALDTAHE